MIVSKKNQKFSGTYNLSSLHNKQSSNMIHVQYMDHIKVAIMQFFKDFLNSLIQSVDTRISSPAIGAFITSWSLCNWDRLTLLFLGTPAIEERVKTFSSSLDPQTMSFFWGPLLLTFMYLFALPWANYFIQKIQSSSELERYDSSITTDIKKENKRGELVKAKYKSDHQDKIAEDEIRADIENSKANTERLRAEAASAEEQAQKDAAEKKKAEANASEAKATAEIEITKADKAKMKSEKDRQSFEQTTALHNDKIASLKLPASYKLIESLSESLKQDNVTYTVRSLSEAISATFGYNSFSDILSDENFTNEKLSQLKYIVYDSTELLERLKNILINEDEEDYEENWLFEHIQEVIDATIKIRITDEDSVIEYIQEEIQDSGDILTHDGITGAMAETNAFFDEVSELNVENYTFTEDHSSFEVVLTGSVSGTSDEDRMFYGDTIDVTATARLPVLIGKYGLGGYELDIQGSVSHSWEEENDQSTQASLPNIVPVADKDAEF